MKTRLDMEQTLVILKPDCVQRRLVGRILARFEDKGLKLVALKMLQMDRPLAERLYGVHNGRDFYEPLLAFMTSSPAIALVIEGPDAIRVVRGMLGPTAGTEAPPGTIRGDFGLSSRLNLTHASDSPESAVREIGVLFQPHELLNYEIASGRWVVPPA
jgi:nucleoside-diphosphate kinase